MFRGEGDDDVFMAPDGDIFEDDDGDGSTGDGDILYFFAVAFAVVVTEDPFC